MLRTRKYWLLGLLVLMGALAAVGADAVMTSGEQGWPLTASAMLGPLGLSLVPAIALVLVVCQALGWLPDGVLGWAAPVGVVYGLVGVGLLGWLGYRRWRRL